MIPFASIWPASVVSIACMNGIVSRARKSGDAFVSWTTNLLPFALTPEIVRALPSITAWAPLTMSRNCTPVDCIRGFAKRLNESTKLLAVTGLPFEKRKPGLIVNVYVLPSRETIGSPRATSGVATAPATPSLSCQFISLQAVAASSFHVSP